VKIKKRTWNDILARLGRLEESLAVAVQENKVLAAEVERVVRERHETEIAFRVALAARPVVSEPIPLSQ
jgi:hypothetical protein